MRKVTLRVRHHGEPESDVSARYPEVTLRSLSSLTGTAAERKRIIEVSGTPSAIPSFLEEFRESDSVVAAEPLSPLGESRVYVALTYDAARWDSIAERLKDLGVHYRTGTTITAGWEQWTMYLGDDDDLGAIVDSLEDGGNDAELVHDVPLADMDATEQLDFSQFIRELTPRQRDVLSTAIRLGYYQPNKDTSIAEIGAEIGIASTTAWEHLVRAESKVMAEVGELLTR